MNWHLLILALGASLLVTGCSATKPTPAATVVTERVEVPVYRKAVPPGELLICDTGFELPMARVIPAGIYRHPNGIVVELSTDALAFDQPEQDKLQALLDSLKTCAEAWKAWGGAP